jgi:hypothetical protein
MSSVCVSDVGVIPALLGDGVYIQNIHQALNFFVETGLEGYALML